MRSTKRKSSKRLIYSRVVLSIFLTLIIVASLVLVNVQTASAVTLGISCSPVAQCSNLPITITATITIDSSDNRVPLDNILLFIDGAQVADFEVNGSINSRTNPPVVSITGPTVPSPYGYGYDSNRYGYGYGFNGTSIGDHYWNWGNGYGYGPITLTYTIVLNMSGRASGAHTARLQAHLVSSPDYFLSPERTFILASCSGRSGGGGGGYSPAVRTDLWGAQVGWSMYNDGTLRENVSASSPDGNVSIYIPAGTKMLDSNGNVLSSITMTNMTPLPEAPEGYYLLNAFNFEPDGATFDPGFQLTIKYDPASIPAGFLEGNLVIGIYDDVTGTYTYLTGTVDTVNHTITFTVAHFTIFALMAAPTPPTPAPTATATPAPTQTPTQTVAPTPTATSTPTATPAVGPAASGGDMPDAWVMIIIAIAAGALLAGLIGAVAYRAKNKDKSVKSGKGKGQKSSGDEDDFEAEGTTKHKKRL